jgi:hypothetical protein
MSARTQIPRRCQNPKCAKLVYPGEKYRKGLCLNCYDFKHRTGQDRDPETLWRGSGRKSPPWPAEPVDFAESDERIRARLGL